MIRSFHEKWQIQGCSQSCCGDSPDDGPWEILAEFDTREEAVEKLTGYNNKAEPWGYWIRLARVTFDGVANFTVSSLVGSG